MTCERTDHDFAYLVIAAGYSERVFTVEVRGVYLHRSQASAAAVTMRTNDPHLIFRVEAHRIVDAQSHEGLAK